jgi:hypothetical protein
MPITTPAQPVSDYGDDPDHFKHVLEYLFKPAINKAGYAVIQPSAEGSDLIHAELIKHLEQEDMVLCDVSCLNPNVFFEFGIRTAVNKPVCIVKDALTKNVPFDTGILNYMQYDASLTPWTIGGQIEALANHLLKAEQNCRGVNPLWRYFGLSSLAKLKQEAAGDETKLDLLFMEVASISDRLKEAQKRDDVPPPATKAASKRSPDSQPECLVIADPKLGPYELAARHEPRYNVLCGPARSVAGFLNEIYFSLMPLVKPYTFGIRWALKNAATNERLQSLESSWSRGETEETDPRTLEQLGVKAGMVLVAFPLDESRSEKGKPPGH